jgi:hypothetical protein
MPAVDFIHLSDNAFKDCQGVSGISPTSSEFPYAACCFVQFMFRHPMPVKAVDPNQERRMDHPHGFCCVVHDQFGQRDPAKLHAPPATNLIRQVAEPAEIDNRRLDSQGGFLVRETVGQNLKAGLKASNAKFIQNLSLPALSTCAEVSQHSFPATFADLKGATTLDTLMQVAADAPVPPSHLRPGVPAELEAVCLRCLEKTPGQRPASARALAEELERFLVEGTRGRGPKPPTPWPRGLGIATGLTLVFGVVTVFVLDVPWLNTPGFLSLFAAFILGILTMQQWTALAARAPRRGPMPRALAFRPEGRMLAVGSADGSLRLWDLGAEEVRLLAGDRARPGPKSVLVGSVVNTPSEPRPAAWAVAWVTRDERPFLAVVDAAGAVKFWDPASDQEPPASLVVVGKTQRVYAAAFSPCGRWLVTARGAWTLRP